MLGVALLFFKIAAGDWFLRSQQQMRTFPVALLIQWRRRWEPLNFYLHYAVGVHGAVLTNENGVRLLFVFNCLWPSNLMWKHLQFSCNSSSKEELHSVKEEETSWRLGHARACCLAVLSSQNCKGIGWKAVLHLERNLEILGTLPPTGFCKRRLWDCIAWQEMSFLQVHP